MYKGWIKSSMAFQKSIGFSYQGKHHRRNGFYKFFYVEVTDEQHEKMKRIWKRFKEDIQWDLRKEVYAVYGIREGEIRASILSGHRYFYNRYRNLFHVSKLREWTIDNGLYVLRREKYVDEGYKALKAHITQDGSVYSEHEEYINESTKSNTFDEEDINAYINNLHKIKKQLIKLKE